jgi:4a-hydroxytetrahydrobiopterin dehydratase
MKKMLQSLKKGDVTKILKELHGWSVNTGGTQLSKILRFENHDDALEYIAKITAHAQVLNHHPDILFTYKKLKVTLSTHEAKGITQIDIELAKRIDSLTRSGQ